MKKFFSAIPVGDKSHRCWKISISRYMVTVTMGIHKILYWLAGNPFNPIDNAIYRFFIHFRVNHEDPIITDVCSPACAPST
jgi:hypothetical protein